MNRKSPLTYIDMNGPYHDRGYSLSRVDYGAPIKRAASNPLTWASKAMLVIAVVFFIAAFAVKFMVAK